MDPKHLEELIAVERSYWWHVAKRELATALLTRHFPPPGRLVEGGLGGGANLVAFRELGYDVAGLDLMPEAVAHCRGNLGLADVRVHDLQTPWPAEPKSARAIVMLDVIEHVRDPVAVLRNAATLLEPGGGIVVTVPANPRLMGPWDVMLGHYRRYSRRMLREHAERAGLALSWASHWNSFTLPAAYAIRTAERLTGNRRSAEFPKVSAAVNALLKRSAAVERRLMKMAPIPAGLSLVGVLTPPRTEATRHEYRPHTRPKADGRGARLGGPARL